MIVMRSNLNVHVEKTKMSNNTNTQLAEQLNDLEEEVKDCQRSYDIDEQWMKDGTEAFKRSELNLYKAKVALLEFEKRMQHD